MFPLGSVLFPAMPLPLRVFEDRYLAMLAAVLDAEPAEFGVVLIERGQEVGGGDTRFPIGTVAQIVELEAGEGFVIVLSLGARRVRVTEWKDDAPYPVAEVEDLPALTWDAALQPLRERAEKAVRTGLARASEYVELQWSPDVELDDDPVDAAWQLAAIAPLGPLDQVALLGATSVETLLEQVIELTEAAVDALQFSWVEQRDDDDDAGSETAD